MGIRFEDFSNETMSKASRESARTADAIFSAAAIRHPTITDALESAYRDMFHAIEKRGEMERELEALRIDKSVADGVQKERGAISELPAPGSIWRTSTPGPAGWRVVCVGDGIVELRAYDGSLTRYLTLEEFGRDYRFDASPEEPTPTIPMLLHCPLCNERHIDEGEFETKPHHTHACQECGHVWRPALGCTVGVRFLPGFKNRER